MARRGRGKPKAALKRKTAPLSALKASGATSLGHSVNVHPPTNDCYPLNKLCRLCLLSNTNMEPIFSYNGDNRLAQKIFQCTNLKITEYVDQGIPTSICGQCKKQLDQCYEFRLLCWKNNEVLHNLHAILSPKKASHPAMRSNPIVQLEKLPLNSDLMTPKAINLQQLYSPAKRGRGANSSKQNFGEIALNQLYTPSRRGHNAAKSFPRFSKELVVRLTPVSMALVNKYKKTQVTQTKAAVKSFPQSEKRRGRPPKQVTKTNAISRVEKRVVKPVKPVKPAKPIKPVKAVTPVKSAKPAKSEKQKKNKKPAKVPAPVVKKPKIKREIAMPPKKRKENFQTSVSAATVMVTCSLCMQPFNNEKNLSRHMATHENSRKQNRVFSCDLCQKEYLKASQLTDHLRSSEHIQNAAADVPDDADVSILPDEDEAEAAESILPDNDEDQMLAFEQTAIARSPAPVESSQDAEPEPEEITDQPVDHEVERPQPSPDTNETSQPIVPVEDEEQPAEVFQPEAVEPPVEEPNINRDASPIPVDSESSRSREGGVQYSDVCSTNNAENLFNGSEADSFNASRRVTFSDITEIVE